MDALALRIYNATLLIYQRLFEKEHGHGGLSDDEFTKLKALFLDATCQASDLLHKFMHKCTGLGCDDIDSLIDYAEGEEVLYYSKHWKNMYHGLRKRIEENRMVNNDRRNLLSAYNLLKILNGRLSAWYIVVNETETSSVSSKEQFLQLAAYLSSDLGLINEYPGISFVEQTSVASKIQTYDWVDYAIEFRRRMNKLMRERGLEPYKTISKEFENKVSGYPYGQPKFRTEVERSVLQALEEKKTLDFIYYTFENGHSYASCRSIVPSSLRYEDEQWLIVGEDTNHEQHEFILPFILSTEQNEVHKLKERMKQAFKNAVSNYDLTD